MAILLSPIGNDAPFFLSTGVAASGAKLFVYAAGSSTKAVTYADSGGITQNANPIILNSSGYPASAGNVIEIWAASGSNYKFILAPSTDTDPPASPYWTRDVIPMINDTTLTVSEWVAGPTPTYVSATSFTLVGDQTGTFTVGRRLKTTNSGGTVYSTITVSAYTSLTTVTVVNDSSTLDSGLSAVSYGLLASSGVSVPPYGSVTYVSGVGGSANAITGTASVTAAGLRTGQVFCIIPTATNTGATTLNINSLGAKSIFAANAALVGGELHANIPVLLLYDGTVLQLQGPVFKQPTRQVLTSGSGATYTTPTGATHINVRLCGGGGGGQGGIGANQAGASGAGGGYSEKLITAPSTTYTYTVGAAGSAGAAAGNGGDGGTTSFSTISATGGKGGSTAANINGGVGSGGDINAAGQGGVVSESTTLQQSFPGGSSLLGGGGSAAHNVAGQAPPGGFGGGGSGGSNNSVGGGAGFAGVIIVDEWYS